MVLSLLAIQQKMEGLVEVVLQLGLVDYMEQEQVIVVVILPP